VRENEKARRWYEREGFMYEKEEVASATGFMMKATSRLAAAPGRSVRRVPFTPEELTYVFALSFGRDFSIIRQGSAITQREPLMQRMLLGELILGPYNELTQASLSSQPDKVADNLALREYARALLTASLDRALPWMLRR